MDAFYRFRDGIAAVPSLLLLAAMQTLVVRPTPMPQTPDTETIEITLLSPLPEPSPALPSPTPPITRKDTVARPAPAATTKEAPPPMKSGAVPVTTENASLSLAPEASHATPDSAPKSESAPLQTPPQELKPSADLETAYVAKVRQILNAVKRYPTGREASLLRPSGTVRVWLVLDRHGRLLERGIDVSSQSMLLDNAALRTIDRAIYPPFPDELWPNQSQHRFHVDIDFVVPNS